jgi:signal transduction histidine kinase
MKFFIKRFEQQTGIVCKMTIREHLPKMQNERLIAVYRIIQETFTNVYRHAKATEIIFHMDYDQNDLLVSISDNGTGIPDNRIDDVSSLGIVGMKERALFLRAALDIASNDGIGTTIRLSVPISGERIADD